MHNRFRFVPLLMLHSAVLCAAEAPLLRAADGHTHGQLLLNIAVEAGQVSVEIESAAVNLLGFEHSPATPAEIALVASVGARVLEHESLLRFVADACIQTDAASEFRIFSDASDAGEAHVHADGEEHGAHAAAHGDILLRYQLACSRVDGLAVEFSGFAGFPGIAEVVVQWLNDTTQGRVILTPDNPGFRLE